MLRFRLAICQVQLTVSAMIRHKKNRFLNDSLLWPNASAKE